MSVMSGSTLTFRDHARVVAELTPVKTKWYAIGRQFSMDEGVISRIYSDYPTEQDRLDMMVSQWLANGKPMWGALVKALRSRRVGEPYLAEIIRQKNCPRLVLPPLTSTVTDLPTIVVNPAATSSSGATQTDLTGLNRKRLHSEVTEALSTDKRMRIDDSALNSDPPSYALDDFVSTQSTDFICVKCWRVPRKPLRSRCCGTLLCEPCSLELDTCFIHGIFAEYRIDSALRIKISKLMVRCLNGCGTKCAVYQMRDHMPLCTEKSSNQKRINIAKSAQSTNATTTSIEPVGVALSGTTPPTSSSQPSPVAASSVNNDSLMREPLKRNGANLDQDHGDVVVPFPVTPPSLPVVAEVVPGSHPTHLSTTPLPQQQDTPFSEIQTTIGKVMAIMDAANRKRAAAMNGSPPSTKSTTVAPDKKKTNVSPATPPTTPTATVTTPTSRMTTPITVVAPKPVNNPIAPSGIPVTTPTIVTTPTTPPLPDADASSLKLGQPFSLHPSAKKNTAKAVSASSTTPTTIPLLPAVSAAAKKTTLPPASSPSLSATPTTKSSKVTVVPSVPSSASSQLDLLNMLKNYSALQNIPGLNKSPSVVGDPAVLQKLVESLKQTLPTTKVDDTSTSMTKKEKEKSLKKVPLTMSCKAPLVAEAATAPVDSQSSVGTITTVRSVVKSKPITSHITRSLLLPGNKTNSMQTRNTSKGIVASAVGKTVGSKSPKSVAVEISKVKLSGAGISAASGKLSKPPPSQEMDTSEPTAVQSLKAALSAEGVTEETSDSISCKGPADSTPKPATPRDDVPLETKIRRLHGYEQKLSCPVCLGRWKGCFSGGGYIKHWKRFHSNKLLTAPNITQVTTIAKSNNSMAKSDVTTLPVTKTNETTLPVTKSNETTLPVTKSNATTLPVTKTNKTTLPVTKSNETTLPVTKSNETTLPVTKSNATTLPVTKSNATTLPVSKSNETTLPVTKSNETTLPFTKSNTTTLLVTKSNATTLPVTKSNETTLPVTKSSGITLPVTKSNGTTLPVTKSSGTTLPVTKSSGTTLLPVTKSNETTLPVTKSSGTTLPFDEGKVTIVPNTKSDVSTVPVYECEATILPVTECIETTLPVTKSDVVILVDEDFSVKPRREVHCSKCGRVPLEPWRPKCCCNVVYCPPCANAVPNCPLCGKSKGFDLDWMMKKRIGNFQVRCLYKSEGCDWKGAATTRAEHVVVCPKQSRPCKYSPLGCDEVVSPSDEGRHDTTYKDRHLQLAMDKVLMLVDQVQTLRDEIDKLKKK